MNDARGWCVLEACHMSAYSWLLEPSTGILRKVHMARLYGKPRSLPAVLRIFKDLACVQVIPNVVRAFSGLHEFRKEIPYLSTNVEFA